MMTSAEVQAINMQNLQALQMQQQATYQSGMPFGYGAQGHNLPSNGFSFSGNSTGYGTSNQIGQGVVNSAQGVFKGASYGITGAAAAIGYRASGLSGALKGGLAAGGALGGLGFAAGGHVFGSLTEGANEQQSIFNTLGQGNQFGNAQSRTGRGFSRTDAKAISDTVRELSSIPELMTSMSELNGILSKVQQIGGMNGSRNAQEFGRKFKETITTLKDISKVMETSMEGALKYFEESRKSGLYNPQMMKMNMGQRQFTAGLTGMDQGQIGQLQMAGSQISFGYGGTRGSGAQSALRSARQIGMANEMGLISNDRIAELTGQEGGAGIAAMAGSLTDASQRMSQGGLGTAMSIALAKQKNGKFTGELDQELVEKVRMGGISKSELLSLAHKKTSSRASKMSFKANENLLRSEMASQVGAEGIGMELQDILGGAGFNNPDASGILMKRYGVDEKQAKMIQEMGNSLPQIQRELGSKAQMEGRRQAEQSYLKENMSTDAIKRKFMKRMENTFSEPFKHLGANMSNAVGQYVDDFMDGLLGRYSTNITKETSNLAGGALGGSSGSQSKLAGMLGGLGKMDLSRGKTNYSTGDSIVAALTGTRSNDMNRYDALNSLVGSGLASSGSGGIAQTNEQIAGTKRRFAELQEGRFGDRLSGKESLPAGFSKGYGGSLFSGKGLQGLSEAQNSISGIIQEHGNELRKMSQMERVQFIKGKLGPGAAQRLLSTGTSIEDLIASAQDKHGIKDNLGSVNFNKYSSELYGTGDFGSAKDLQLAESSARSNLSKQFGKQESNVEALLKTDGKARDLFLKASGGDKDAIRLLKKDLSTQEKEKLLSKFGIKESELEGIQDMYGGAGDAKITGADRLTTAINRGSVGGLAAQYRRQGNDISNRASGMHLLGGQYGAKDQISALANSLSGLTDADKLGTFLNGGLGAKQIDAALNAASGLKGHQRELALAALGEGASSAIGFGSYVSKAAGRKGGLESLKGKLPEELIKEFEGRAHGGRLSGKDAEELGHRARNTAYGSALSSSGNVVAKEVQYQKELGENLNRFAQTTSQFAQLVVQATPQLDASVKKAQAAVTESSNIKPGN